MLCAEIIPTRERRQGAQTKAGKSIDDKGEGTTGIKSIRALIGLPVLLGDKTIGHLVDVELDEALGKMTGIISDGGLSGTRRIPAREIILLGEVSVLASGKGHPARLKEQVLRRVLLPDGCRVGAVTGAMLDERTKNVTALELSRGYFEDLTCGRQWIFRYAVNPGSGDVLIGAEGGDAE